ncbi:MAG: EamA family transporter [Chloroflexi bacterium]|nr:EamA family transporter [Chloroflexota bacterium]
MGAIFFALLSALLAALVAILSKMGVSEVDSNLATAIRAVIMAIFMLTVTAVQGTISKVGTIPKIPLLYIVLSGLVGALSWVAYFRALQLGKVSQIAPIDRLSVVFAVVLAALILKEKVNVQTWVGVGVMAAGAIMVSLA